MARSVVLSVPSQPRKENENMHERLLADLLGLPEEIIHGLMSARTHNGEIPADRVLGIIEKWGYLHWKEVARIIELAVIKKPQSADALLEKIRVRIEDAHRQPLKIVRYRERGILKRLRATPINIKTFFAAEVLAHLVLALMQAVVILSVGRIIFNIHVFGSYVWLVLITLFGTVVFLNLGFFLAGFAKTTNRPNCFQTYSPASWIIYRSRHS